MTTLFGLFLVTLANGENVTVIDGSSSNATIKQVVGGNPIVIHTQLQHYDQPTLKEYQECHENLEKCKIVCEGVENPTQCAKECPVCPLLIKEQIVVQGINDTDHRPASATPLNTTNIIRLTNQIQNIIENDRGSITYRNENIVQIHQNISRVGGKFGFGYNNTDPCCIILRPTKNCESRKFSTAARCHRKRHRVCGKQCKSRVMLAKRVTVCEQPETEDDYEDGTEENCHQTVKYIPYNRRRRTTRRQASKCNYVPSWPFVSCPNRSAHKKSSCVSCQRLPYAYILRNGMPPQCRRCFMAYSNPDYGYPVFGGYDMYSPPWYPMKPPLMDDDFETDYDFDMGGWKQDKTKCKLPNGEISDNCNEVEGSGTDNPNIIDESHHPPGPTTEDPWGYLPESQDEYNDYEEDDDNLYDGPITRRRRHTFQRSKYSRRYKQ